MPGSRVLKAVYRRSTDREGAAEAALLVTGGWPTFAFFAKVGIGRKSAGSCDAVLRMGSTIS